MRLVIAPWLRFAELAERLAALGWEGGAAVVYAPLVPGEPEVARWSKGAAALTYTCNPAVWLRLLEADGAIEPADRDVIVAVLPHLGEVAISDLLGSHDDDQLVLGLLAVEALGLTGAGAAVARAEHHERAMVRDVAEAVGRSLRAGRCPRPPSPQ